MPSIKLKDAQGNVQIHEDVSVIKVKDINDNDVQFKEAVGVVVAFIELSGSPAYSVMDVKSGRSVQAPQEPAREGYIFRGWSLVSHEFIPANRITFPHLFEESTTLYAMWEQRVLAGTAQITGLGSEQLTDVFFNVSDDFLTPIQTVTDDNGDVWREIPTLYRKITAQDGNGQITGKIMSWTKVDNTYVPYSVFVKPNGQVMPYVRIGVYCIRSGSIAESKSGNPTTMAIGAARTLARARGVGYQLYDWQFRELFNDLALAEKKNMEINATTIIGTQQWNQQTWIDGFSHDNRTYRICYDPSKYVDSPTAESDGYSELSYQMPTGNGGIKELGYDSNHPFALFPKTGGGSYATYYPDQYYHNNSNYPVYCAVGYSAAYYGLFYFNGLAGWANAYGVRLCYRPI